MRRGASICLCGDPNHSGFVHGGTRMTDAERSETDAAGDHVDLGKAC
jgi:hypothetical protein